MHDNDFPLQSEYSYASSPSPAISITDTLGILRREWLFPVVGCLMGLALALSYILFVTSPLQE